MMSQVLCHTCLIQGHCGQLFPQAKGTQEWDLIQIMALGSVLGKNHPDGQNPEAG